MDPRSAPRFAFFLSASACFCAWSTVPALAQVKIQAKVRINGVAVQADEESEGDAEATFVQPEREQLIVLSQAEKLLAEERFAEAVRLLGEILNGDQDGALPKQGNERVRFLKAEAQRLVGSMSKAGHDAYELQFGKSAEQLLEQAVGQGSVTGLEGVVRQFFHTQAGYDATHLLGLYHMEHGRPLAAALAFDRLVQTPAARDVYEPELSYRLALCWHWSGIDDAARRVLVDLKSRQPDARLQIAGRETRLFETESEIDSWLVKLAGERPTLHGQELEQWAMFRGGATRNVASNGGRPLLNYRWRVPVTDDPNLMEFVGQLRENHLDQNVSGIPALHPLAVGELILMRTSQQLLAVDFATGKRIWEVKIDEQIEGMFEGRKPLQPQAAFNLSNALDQRLWEDNTFGTLSSDGEYVYSIEDLGLTSVPNNNNGQRMVVQLNGRRRPDSSVRKFNRLAAHELSTQGKLKWSLGGPAGDEEFPEAGTFFLGAPLPLGGRLYVLAEAKGEIRLLAIDPKKDPFRGEKLVEWSLPLAVVETSVFDNNERRLAGVSPSYADGVMVCPTGAGVVVGVDLTTRSLLWGRTFARANGGNVLNRANRIAMMRMGLGNDGNQEGRDNWIDSSVTIADGKAILTPVESDKIICLRLTDGELAWEQDRDTHKDGLYLACVEEGLAVVVGRTAVRAFKLDDGTQAWECGLASSGAPSGRGFANGGRYYLPLNSAEVLTLDIATGKELERARSRQGLIPGNLICHQGAVISQGVESVDCFYQSAEIERQVAETLKKNPDDPEALALRGELLLDAGQIDEAAEQLRRSLALRDDPRAKDLLVDALLEGLRTDFAAYRGHSNEIESLVSAPSQWDNYLRLMAAGLHAAGEHLPAFDAYMRLAALKLDGPGLARVEPGLQVRRDRWVQARLAALRETVVEADRLKMDGMIADRLQAALAREAGTEDELRQFLKFFGMHPTANTARQELASRLSERESALEIELLSRRVARTDDREAAGKALARLAA
ncbi:MAG: PQQ-binding-like beta-propeller repeat protein, partial [Pirellulales bacterium]